PFPHSPSARSAFECRRAHCGAQWGRADRHQPARRGRGLAYRQARRRYRCRYRFAAAAPGRMECAAAEAFRCRARAAARRGRRANARLALAPSAAVLLPVAAAFTPTRWWDLARRVIEKAPAVDRMTTKSPGTLWVRGISLGGGGGN